MLKESVGRFAREIVLPKVREMDEAEKMDKGIVEQLFEQGLMGVEVEEEYGGAGMGFGSAVVAIEELARIDPSVSSDLPWGLKSRGSISREPRQELTLPRSLSW